MITIACPKCSAKLRVDPAFQGLTCRCTHCQALLGIPSDAARMPIRLVQEPSSASKAGTSNGSQMADVYSKTAAPSLNVVQTPGGGPAPEKLISLESSRGRGGGGNRAALLAGAVGAGALILAVGVVLVVLIAGRSGASGPTSAYAAPPAPARPAQPASPTAGPAKAGAPARPATPAAPAAPALSDDNPHGWGAPTVLGLPLAGHTAVFVDAVDQSLPWIDAVNASLLKTFSKGGNGERVSVFYLADGEVRSLPRQPLPTGRALRSSLARLQGSVEAGGGRGFYDGLNAALGVSPDHLVLVTGRTKWSAAGPYILEQVKKATGQPTFSVLAFGGGAVELQKIADATGGEIIPMQGRTVERWNR